MDGVYTDERLAVICLVDGIAFDSGESIPTYASYGEDDVVFTSNIYCATKFEVGSPDLSLLVDNIMRQFGDRFVSIVEVPKVIFGTAMRNMWPECRNEWVSSVAI